MSISTKSQFYQHTLKLGGVTDVTMCSNRAWLYLRPPEDALSIEGLYCRLRFTFHSSTSAADRKIEKIGISDRRSRTPGYYRELEINQVADANRVVDVTIDLTTLLKSDDILFGDAFADFIATGGYTMVYFTLPTTFFQQLSNVGTIDIWKLDGMFTTKEIR